MAGASPVRVYLGLGSNIDPEAHLPAALRLLAGIPGSALSAASAIYRTPPWGNLDQPPFLNAVVALETDLAPLALLDATQAVENALQRERKEHWGPRTMDVDLLLFGNEIIEEERLTVPHPYLHQRAFVLLPLCEIAPEAKHPESGRSMAELLAALAPEEGEGIEKVELPGWEWPAEQSRSRD